MSIVAVAFLVAGLNVLGSPPAVQRLLAYKAFWTFSAGIVAFGVYSVDGVPTRRWLTKVGDEVDYRTFPPRTDVNSKLPVELEIAVAWNVAAPKHHLPAGICPARRKPIAAPTSFSKAGQAAPTSAACGWSEASTALFTKPIGKLSFRLACARMTATDYVGMLLGCEELFLTDWASSARIYLRHRRPPVKVDCVQGRRQFTPAVVPAFIILKYGENGMQWISKEGYSAVPDGAVAPRVITGSMT